MIFDVLGNISHGFKLKMYGSGYQPEKLKIQLSFRSHNDIDICK